MRHFSEFRRAWTHASGQAIDTGKKLLAYLANQKRLSGVDSLVTRQTLEDGTIVEARWDKDIPTVRILAADGSDICSMYVETGLLDLGPNIAPDASARFDRGLPQFGEEPATLHFGTSVDCADGLNGLVQLGGIELRSQCLSAGGTAVASRLTDPVKKQAQAALPASCWSGLMRRYVQAVYGGASLSYETDGSTLAVEGVNVGGIGASVGLVEVNGTHRFIYAGSGTVLASGLRFKSACGGAVYRLWQLTHASLPAARADKILTIALSDAYPDNALTPIGDAGELTFASPYGWQFDPDAPEAHAVTFTATHATLKKLVIGAEASVSDVESAELAPAFPCVVRGPQGELTSVGADGPLTFGQSFDHPLHCLYDDGLIVVRYTVETPAHVAETQPGWECVDQNNGEISGWQASWPMDLADDARNCSAVGMQQGGSRLIDGFNARPKSHNRFTMTSGLYAKRAAEVLWSTVRTGEAHAGLMYVDDASDEGSPVGKTWCIQSGWNMQVRTYNLGGSSSHTTTLVADLYDSGDPVDPLENQPSGLDLCTTLQPLLYGYPYPVEDYCAYRGPTVWGTSCTEWERWPLNDTTGHTLSVTTDSQTVTCTVPCYDGHQHGFDDELILGPVSQLALPLGDCGATVAVTVNTSGTRPSENPFSEGYTFGSDTFCNPTVTGECAGTWTVTCNGYNPLTTSFDHAPHDFLYSTYASINLPYYQTLFTEPNRGGIAADSDWRKHRLVTDWLSVSASGATVHETLTHEGAFEEIVEGSETAWEATENPVTCAFLHGIVWGALADDPTDVDSLDGATSVEKRLLVNPDTLLQDGFAYVFRTSLLGARTHWTTALTFGHSVGMDRESLTGGYVPVTTPSFVGWA